MFYIIFIITFLAGIVQGVTGFGAGIVMMMVMPYFFNTLAAAAGTSTAISFVLNTMMVFNYRKFVDFKKIIPPAILYIIVCSGTIVFSKYVNQIIMKKVFGCFLLLLCFYYLVINKNSNRKKFSLFVSIIFIVVSACCDGLFGIGGPLMVLYFLSNTHNTHEYLGNIQAFFLINCIYNTCFRIMNGIIVLEYLPYILIGWGGILLGGMIAGKVIDRLNPMIIQKLIYITIGIAGFINIIQ